MIYGPLGPRNSYSYYTTLLHWMTTLISVNGGLEIMVHACNISTRVAEAGGLGDRGQPRLYSLTLVWAIK